MLTTSKTHQKTWPVLLTVYATLLLWLGSKVYYQDWFSDPYKYPAKASSLSATVLMVWGMILSARFFFLENFFGGGVGITPFLGMWHVALHSEERLDSREFPERLRHLHPELIKTKSPLVHLFYVCRTEQEASFDDDIRHEVTMSHFHGFKAFEERGHHYELYLTSKQGRITADYVDQRVKEGVRDKNIFLCGPSPMVESLIGQFKSLGVKDHQISVEDFNLV